VDWQPKIRGCVAKNLLVYRIANNTFVRITYTIPKIAYTNAISSITDFVLA